MEGRMKTKIIDTFIEVVPVSQNDNINYYHYRSLIIDHFKKLGFKFKRNYRIKIDRKFEVDLVFNIVKDYDLDNLIKRFCDILRHFLNADDVNTLKIRAEKRMKPNVGIKVKVYELFPFKAL
jgi:Holliday junction resolvase RusA-like endonuclease